MTKRIPPLDLIFYVMEAQTSPTHVGALLLFEQPAGRPGLVREIVEAYRSDVRASTARHWWACFRRPSSLHPST